MRVGAEADVTFTDLLANGQAVGRSGGVVIFCFGPLPRERARVRVVSAKPKYMVAEMLELLEPSPDRVNPFCPVFGVCGGCQVQHLSYPGQLAWKREVVRNALGRIGGFVGIDVREPIGMSDPRNYRNKMSLVVEQASASPTIGFYQQRSHDVVPIDACPIVAPQLSDYIGRLNRARGDPAVLPALLETQHVVARSARATQQSVATFTTVGPSAAVERAATAIAAQLPGTVGIVNSFDLNSANAIMGRTQRVVWGEQDIEEFLGGVRFRVSPGSFFQVNVEIVDRIFAFLQPGLREPRRIVDLYCGAGTFSLFFANAGSTVTGVEENPQAVIEARANAELNGLESRVAFHAGRVEELARTPTLHAALGKAEIVFLDPPRKGSEEAALRAVAASAVPNVWYLSCDPATLARDLKVLVANGYRLGVVQPFDMFPQTGHVETLVTLYHQTGVLDTCPNQLTYATSPNSRASS
ncbi:MAG TPA: 23S rRNA (uracil(1939)-C(5))-methyltransferase RlmD [Candidatus Baltobacteraceae bacterium]